jgi:hypothetical protein
MTKRRDDQQLSLKLLDKSTTDARAVGEKKSNVRSFVNAALSL